MTGLKEAANWLRRNANAEKDPKARAALIEAHNAILQIGSTMIDRKLLSRAAALLSEARDVIERVRTKAQDYPADTDENDIAELSILITAIESTFRAVDKLDQRIDQRTANRIYDREDN